MEDFTLNNGSFRFTSAACRRNSAHMLPVTDWLSDLPENVSEGDLVEVQFKNTRKGYFHNVHHLPLKKGDKVVVNAIPGHDLGEVTLVGMLVPKQMKKYRIDLARYEILDIYRLASEGDLARAAEAHAREQATMIEARAIAKSLGLEMKIGDVEFQGDGGKAIFYYIADGRVDFRQLIKVYAESFRVRIEMKQIGARQEAGRIGGTGPCGRELCCSTWMTNFHSVNTDAARLQRISLNPQKLAGQCAKLKCCLNYEIDAYEEASAKLPAEDVVLHTLDSDYYFFSADPLAGKVTYSSSKDVPANLETISPEHAREIIALNKAGQKPASLGGKSISSDEVEIGYQSGEGQDALNRFDRMRGPRRRFSSRDGKEGYTRDGKDSNLRDGNRPPRENNRDNKDGNRRDANFRPRDNKEGRDNRDRRPNNREAHGDNRQRDNRPRNNRPNDGSRPNRPNNGPRPNRRESNATPQSTSHPSNSQPNA